LSLDSAWIADIYARQGDEKGLGRQAAGRACTSLGQLHYEKQFQRTTFVLIFSGIFRTTSIPEYSAIGLPLRLTGDGGYATARIRQRAEQHFAGYKGPIKTWLCLTGVSDMFPHTRRCVKDYWLLKCLEFAKNQILALESETASARVKMVPDVA